MPDAMAPERVAAVRRFNRFYTQQLGVLHEGWLDSAFSLAQARVLYEISRRDGVTARELAAELGLDPGYLSRILRGFEVRGLISRRISDADARQSFLALTGRGRRAYAPLEQRTVPARREHRLAAAVHEPRAEAELGERRADLGGHRAEPDPAGDLLRRIGRQRIAFLRCAAVLTTVDI